MASATATLTLGTPATPDRFSTYFGYALAVHIVAIVVLMVVPSEWLRGTSDAERNVMYISLAGSDGQETTGLRSIAARPVQEATPERVRPQYQAPAEKPPEMAVPERVTRTPPRPAPEAVPEATRPNRRTPIRGAEVREGQARVDTGALTGGDGLSLGSSGTGGETNLANFCCPAYIQAMSAAIRRNWKQQQGVAG